jgi:uncharacterized protein (TIGR02147 family)
MSVPTGAVTQAVEIGMHTDIRTYLREVLSKRQSRAAGYSLRAFARDLSISPSRLSEILAGDRLSPAKAKTICERLALNEDETRYFLALLVIEDEAASHKQRNQAQRDIHSYLSQRAFQEISLDTFRVIADWYHLAIIEYIRTQQFCSMDELVSYFGLTPGTVQGALLRLQKLDLLAIQDGRFTLTSRNHQIFAQAPSKAVQEFHRQVMQKGIKALETEKEKREFNSIYFTLSPNALPTLREKIRSFLRETLEEPHPADQPSEVYALSMQLFPLGQQPSSLPRTASPPPAPQH